MRILFIERSLKGEGGIQREAYTLFRALSSNGIRFAAIAEKLVPFKVDFPLYSLTRNSPKKWEHEIRAAIEDFQPQVLHFLAARGQLLPLIRRFSRTIPTVMTVHCVAPHERPGQLFLGRNKLYYWARNIEWAPSILFWRYYLRSNGFSKAIYHSQFVEQQLRKGGCPEHKLAYIPLAADHISLDKNSNGASVYPKEAFPRIACVAAYIHHKGYHDLLRALVRLRTIYPKTHAVLIGEIRAKSYVNFLHKLLIQLGLQNNCTLLIQAPEEQKQATLKEADLYIQPSHEEGFCLAFLEAALTVPRCLGTTAGAMCDIGSNLNGIEIVLTHSPEKIAEGACKLLDSNVSQEDLVKRRSDFERRFSLENYIHQHVELYRSLIT